MEAKLTYKIISEVGVQEKYIRKNHYNTIKVWWARRPLTTVRSLLIKEILSKTNNSQDLVDAKLFSEINPTSQSLNSFRKRYKTEDLNLLDVFSGGGAIPFESARLGLTTSSAELNPVASLLQETIFNSLSIPEYSDKLKKAGHGIIDRVERRIGKYFSLGEINPYVIFWSKVAKCKSCNHDLDLRRLQYLSKRKSKPVRIVEQEDDLILVYNLDNEERLRKEFLCKHCGSKNSFKDVKEFCKKEKFRYSPFAFCYTSNGKKYKILDQEEKELLATYSSEISEQLKSLSLLYPKGGVKLKSGVINPTLYDLKEPHDFFSDRQLLVLLTVIDEITEEYFKLDKSVGAFEAKQIVLGLTSLIEFLVDWNSVSTMWISQNEQTGRSLAGPGVGMKWDFIEINPFSKNGSNLKSKIDRVCETFKAIQLNNSINIIQGSSTNLPIGDDSIDIVLTDPPYYDSIDYTGLSEFFRPWFEVVIKKTFCEGINLRNKDEFEAIVELSKKSPKGHDHYQSIMTGVLMEVNRVLKVDGSLLMLYSHKTFEGWKVIADSFFSSKLFVHSCIPIEMERIARPRAMAYDALNGVIAFKLRKNKEEVGTVESDISKLKDMLSSGEMLDSQVVIYLAALAVKQVSLTGQPYEIAYDSVISLYEKKRLEQWINGSMDMITKSYLEAKLKGTLNGLENNYFEILEANDLILNSRLKSMDEINLGIKTKNTILESAVLIYNNFKSNSKTKISFKMEQKESLIAFYSIIGGSQLNTVSNRSSLYEAKVARLVLSKVN